MIQVDLTALALAASAALNVTLVFLLIGVTSYAFKLLKRWQDKVEEGDFVSFRDASRRWRTAVVLLVEDERATVRTCDNWSLANLQVTVPIADLYPVKIPWSR